MSTSKISQLPIVAERTAARPAAKVEKRLAFRQIVTELLKDPRVVALWRFRARSRAELRRLSDRELEDIGVSRREASAEAHKPFWEA